MIKAVIIGFAHMHVNEVSEYINEQPDMVLAACADLKADVEELTETRYTRRWNVKNVKTKYNVKIYDNYTDRLDEIKPDIAFILTETSKKPQVVEQCSMREINVSIEKPIAVSLVEALKIKRCIDLYGIEAIVNWPLTWRPYLHQMKKAVNEGIIGELIKIRFLIGNTGPVGRGAMHRGVTETAEEMTDLDKSKMWWYQKQQGGGALLDFCCYGCMLSNWVAKGDAKSVTAAGGNLATPFADIVDNSVAIVKFPSTLAVLEGTWTTSSRAIPAGPTFFGAEGVICCEKENNIIKVKALRETKIRHTLEKRKQNGYTDLDDFGTVPIPEGYSVEPMYNSENGSFYGYDGMCENFCRVINAHAAYVDPLEMLCGRWRDMLVNYRGDLHYIPDWLKSNEKIQQMSKEATAQWSKRWDESRFPYDHLKPYQEMYNITTGIDSDAHFACDYRIGF